MRGPHAVVQALELTAGGLLVDRGADDQAVGLHDLLVDEGEVVVLDDTSARTAFLEEVDDAGVAARAGLDVQVVQVDELDLGSGFLRPHQGFLHQDLGVAQPPAA